jgi:predicted Rossmann fold flavoprotein
MFPVSNDSQTIIDCLMKEAKKYGVKIRTKTKVEAVVPEENGGFRLSIRKESPEEFDAVVIATGGYNREKAYGWLKTLGHSVHSPVPSLFTFNFREKILSDLAGISVENAHVKIEELQYEESGPVLITHWGLSGPAVLKISAWAARDLHDLEYRFHALVNWVYPLNEQETREELIKLRDQNARKTVSKQDHFPFPNRLWDRFLELSGIKTEKRWADLSNKEIHELTQTLSRSRYNIQGKTTYKEEFVTCGGIPLKEVDPDTLESKIIPNLYFVGEVLDIDGVTGGFNFQAAWTNGWLAANAIAEQN